MEYTKKTGILVMLIVLAAVGVGATLSVYGVITGTANVEAAVVIDSYDIANNEATIRNNADVDVNGDAEDLKVKLGSKETVPVTSTLSSGETEIVSFTKDMVAGDMLYVKIGGNIVNSTEVTTQ